MNLGLSARGANLQGAKGRWGGSFSLSFGVNGPYAVIAKNSHHYNQWQICKCELRDLFRSLFSKRSTLYILN